MLSSSVRLDGECCNCVVSTLSFTVGMVLVRWWALPQSLQTWCLGLRPNTSILVSPDLIILFPTVWESCEKQDVVSFIEDWLLSGHTGDLLQWGWLSFQCLHTGAQPEWRLSNKGPDWSDLESRGCYKLPPFKNYIGHHTLGNLQYCRNICVAVLSLSSFHLMA